MVSAAARVTTVLASADDRRLRTPGTRPSLIRVRSRGD